MKKAMRFLFFSVSVLICLLFVFAPLGEIKVNASAPPRISTVPGDVTGDETVNPKDVLALRQYLGGILTDDEINTENADVTDNDRPDVKDVLRIRKYLGGAIESLGPLYTVMTYNVGQWYNGSGLFMSEEQFPKYLELHKNIIDTYSPDILCVQEYCEGIMPGKSARDNLLTMERFPYMETAKSHNSNYNYVGKAICSVFPIEESTNSTFVTNGTHDSPNYEKAYVWLSGRRVCIISAHPSAHPAAALQELHTLVDDLRDEEYFIVCADTNVNLLDFGYKAALTAMFEIYGVDCKLANGSDFGTHITHPNTGKAIDNIITSTNIVIKSVTVDKQKDAFYGDDLTNVDHYPMVAELYVN